MEGPSQIAIGDRFSTFFCTHGQSGFLGSTAADAVVARQNAPTAPLAAPMSMDLKV
jgi:hypothetical protein